MVCVSGTKDEHPAPRPCFEPGFLESENSSEAERREALATSPVGGRVYLVGVGGTRLRIKVRGVLCLSFGVKRRAKQQTGQLHILSPCRGKLFMHSPGAYNPLGICVFTVCSTHPTTRKEGGNNA